MWKLNNDSSEEQGFRKLTSYIPFLKELLEYVHHENKGVDPERGNIQTQAQELKDFMWTMDKRKPPAKRARGRPLAQQLGSCLRRTSLDGWGAVRQCPQGTKCDWWTAWCVSNVRKFLEEFFKCVGEFVKEFMTDTNKSKQMKKSNSRETKNYTKQENIIRFHFLAH